MHEGKVAVETCADATLKIAGRVPELHETWRVGGVGSRKPQTGLVPLCFLPKPCIMGNAKEMRASHASCRGRKRAAIGLHVVGLHVGTKLSGL